MTIYVFSKENFGGMRPGALLVFDNICSLGTYMIKHWLADYKSKYNWATTFERYVNGGPHGYTSYKVYQAESNSNRSIGRKMKGKEVWEMLVSCKELGRELIKVKLRE